MKTVLVHHLIATLSSGILLTSLPAPPASGSAGGLQAAQHLLGTAVVSADGRKAGEISDFVFDCQGPPRLSDVIVTTGPFGPERAVPVPVIHQTGPTYRIDLTSRAFATVAPLPIDVPAYFATRRNVIRLNREYHLPAPPPDARFFTYTSLDEAEVYGRAGADIGFMTDALFNLNRHDLILLRVLPTILPANTSGAIRLEIPATDVARVTAAEIDLRVPVSDRRLAVACRRAGIVRSMGPAPA